MNCDCLMEITGDGEKIVRHSLNCELFKVAEPADPPPMPHDKEYAEFADELRNYNFEPSLEVDKDQIRKLKAGTQMEERKPMKNSGAPIHAKLNEIRKRYRDGFLGRSKREQIDAEFAGMATDEKYQTVCKELNGESANREPQASPKEWRCYFCDEVFTDEKLAREHFGDCEYEYEGPPACISPLRHDEKARQKELQDGIDYALTMQRRAEKCEEAEVSIQAYRDEIGRLFGNCGGVKASTPHEAWLKLEAAQNEALAWKEANAKSECELQEIAGISGHPGSDALSKAGLTDTLVNRVRFNHRRYMEATHALDQKFLREQGISASLRGLVGRMLERMYWIETNPNNSEYRCRLCNATVHPPFFKVVHSPDCLISEAEAAIKEPHNG